MMWLKVRSVAAPVGATSMRVTSQVLEEAVLAARDDGPPGAQVEAGAAARGSEAPHASVVRPH